MPLARGSSALPSVLLKDGIQGIVNSTELSHDECADSASKVPFTERSSSSDCGVAIEPSLLYMIGDIQDPVVVRRKLASQFQKKTWTNNLELRRKLLSLRLKDGESMQNHIKAMTEIFGLWLMSQLRKRIEWFISWPVFLTLTMSWLLPCKLMKKFIEWKRLPSVCFMKRRK